MRYRAVLQNEQERSIVTSIQYSSPLYGFVSILLSLSVTLFPQCLRYSVADLSPISSALVLSPRPSVLCFCLLFPEPCICKLNAVPSSISIKTRRISSTCRDLKRCPSERSTRPKSSGRAPPRPGKMSTLVTYPTFTQARCRK